MRGRQNEPDGNPAAARVGGEMGAATRRSGIVAATPGTGKRLNSMRGGEGSRNGRRLKARRGGKKGGGGCARTTRVGGEMGGASRPTHSAMTRVKICGITSLDDALV